VGLSSGTYHVVIGPYETRLRVWDARIAPPHARPSAQIVLGAGVVRGQMPLKNFITSDAVIITGLIGAMIAVPIAIHQSKRRDSSSP